jgi:hypothetical protein
MNQQNQQSFADMRRRTADGIEEMTRTGDDNEKPEEPLIYVDVQVPDKTKLSNRHDL